jgi:predicted aminopeptidase
MSYRLWLLLAAAAVLTGCANFGFYAQSIGGQMQILERQRPIEDVLLDPRTPSGLREKLHTVLQIRDFASRELGLPDNASYRQYADLQRPYVVWNVFAAPEFSVKLKKWCFMFAGCVSYRGYFNKEKAEAYAADLRKRGYDVYVGGVSAYSTLGWFDDPVLNTVINRPNVEIAGLIFHELAHQLLYVRDDTVFNESFATAVELEGTRRWLARFGTPDDRALHARAVTREKEFVALIAQYRDRLSALYALEGSDAEKRAGKQRLFEQLARDYAELKAGWGGYTGYDRWLGQSLNNARIGALATYTDLLPAFNGLLTVTHGRLGDFYAAARDLGNMPKLARADRLGVIAAASPPE